MKRILLRIWFLLPPWMERIASAIVRPSYHVIAGAVIFNVQGQILLCKHTYQRMHPWGLPGGDIKFGEDPADAVRRELREETGFTVQETRLILVETSKEERKVGLSYLCTGVIGAFIPNEEVSMIQYFDIDRLPEISEQQQATIEKVLAILKTES